jgi:cytochrome c oxidase subunit 4
MSERVIPVWSYIWVCGFLVLFTILTMFISFIEMPPVWHTVIGLLIAVCKASFVLLIFMHLAISPRLTWTVVLVSCFWLGILLVLTLGDYFSRGMIPFTPGH